jgi:hypothetical protein
MRLCSENINDISPCSVYVTACVICDSCKLVEAKGVETCIRETIGCLKNAKIEIYVHSSAGHELAHHRHIEPQVFSRYFFIYFILDLY